MGHEGHPPEEVSTHSQKAWDSIRTASTAQHLLDDALNDEERARLLSVSDKESGAWLRALPVSSLGLRMDDNTVCIAVGLRLDLQRDPMQPKDPGKLLQQLRRGRKRNISSLPPSHWFSPMAIKTLGAVCPKVYGFADGCGITHSDGDRDTHRLDYLFQHLSVAMQRENCASVLGTITT